MDTFPLLDFGTLADRLSTALTFGAVIVLGVVWFYAKRRAEEWR